MHNSRTIHSYAYRILYLILLSAAIFFCNAYAVSADIFSSVTPESFDRYGNATIPSAPSQDDADTDGNTSNSSGSNMSQGNASNTVQDALDQREDIEVSEFNNATLDTIVYIIGGLAGMMMLLQISAFVVCRVFPSWNAVIAKLSFLGITGYEDGWLAPTIKIALLGVFSYLCISGVIKRVVIFILGWFVTTFNFQF